MPHFLQEVPNLIAEKQQLPLHSAHRPFFQSPVQAASGASVIEWLHSLGLGKYEAVFIQQEIDWDSLQWLTDEVCFMILIIEYQFKKENSDL